MASEFKDFYCTLIENLENYDGEYASFIDCGPNLFKLLCDLLDEDIDRESRLEINAAISYYVVPMDVIPEQIYGPYGYIDDIFISVYVLIDNTGGRHTDILSFRRSRMTIRPGLNEQCG